MASLSDDEPPRLEAERVAREAVAAAAATRQAAVAEAHRLVAEADRLAADAARARQEADRARLALAGPDAPPPPQQQDDVIRTYLDAQAVAVLNIKSLVLILLDNLSPNYNRWKVLFLNTLGKYELSDHVLADATPADADDPHWRRMDCTVRSWLYGTVSPELIEVATTPDPSARSLWLGLQEQFIGNKETRAMILDAEFRHFIQGDLSVSDYCRRLKTMADSLGDLGEAVPDRALVLTVLRGLNGRLSHMASLLKRQRPFPTFAEVRNDLQLEEIELMSKPGSSSTALVAVATTAGAGRTAPAASGGSSGGSTAPRAPAPNAPAVNRSNNRRTNRTKNQQHPRTAGMPTAANPWNGTMQIWAGAAAARPGSFGLLGARPGAPLQPRTSAVQQQALMAQALPSSFPYDASTYGHAPGAPPPGFGGPALHHLYGVPSAYGNGVPSAYGMPSQGVVWDQHALANTFHTMSLTPPPTTDWYMDTGADSHMTSTTGNLLSSQTPSQSSPTSIIVGNGSLLPVTSTGHTHFFAPDRPLHLRHVLVSPDIIKNLISVR